MKKLVNKQGFTLIELMVSIIVFTLFIGMMMSSYFNLAQNLRTTNESRRIYAQGRDLLERIGTEMRKGTIDYDCYTTSDLCGEILANGRTSILAIKTASGEKRILFKADFEQVKLLQQKLDPLQLQQDEDPENQNKTWYPDDGFESNEDWQDLLGEKVKLQELQFLINPISDPTPSAVKLEQLYQPSVTILLSLKRTHAPLNLQTTITSRVY